MTTSTLPDINSKAVRIIGWMASFAAILMYFSYIDQILLNMNGQKGSSVQALATVVNCSLWIAYGLIKPQRDWPIITANLPGIFLGFTAFATSF